jgi:hypothetical protein
MSESPYAMHKDVIAKLIINGERMPLDDEDLRHTATWLRQVADQYEQGELFSSAVFELRIKRKEK